MTALPFNMFLHLRRPTYPVNIVETKHVLVPGFVRAYLRNFRLILMIEVAGIIMTRCLAGHWPSEADRGGLTLGPLLMPLIVFVAFTPRRIEWSDKGFLIHPHLDDYRSYTWQQLKAYGSGNNVFVLRFNNARAYQIDSRAFDRGQWEAFQTFLRSRYPDKRSKSWLLGL